MSHDKVDTRVTAYAFGELVGEDANAFERELRQSSQLRAELEEVREAITALESEFGSDASDVGEAQRETIQRAIVGRTAPPPSPPPRSIEVASDRAYRRALMVASLAACLLIVVGLAAPYLRDPGQQNVAMNDPQEATDAVPAELEKLLTTFNDAMEDGRIDDAEAIARQVQQLQPDDPIARTLILSSQRGRDISQQAAQEPAELEEGAEFAGDLERSQPAIEDPRDEDGSSLSIASVGESSAGERNEELGLAASMTANASGQASGATGDEIDMSVGDFDSNEIEMEMEMGMMGMPPADSTSPQPGGDVVAGGGGGGRGTAAHSRPRSMEMSMMVEEMEMGMGGMMGGMMGGGGDMMMEDMMGGAMMMDDADAMMGGMARDEAVMFGIDMAGGQPMRFRQRMAGRHAGDRFSTITDNPFRAVMQAPLSTFSIDVDTASYAKVRSLLNQNSLPNPNAVRIEELINYFDYDYPGPTAEHPFAASLEVVDCPWNSSHRLARIGIQGKQLEQDRPFSNLVFLLDVSGSMDEPNKLPLVIAGMKMLTDQLTENDRVAIVVYAGAAGLVLESTRGDKKQQIVTALDRLRAGGSTNGGQGILLAYEMARDNFIVGGTNRVILCSDGDFNVGVTGTQALVELAQKQAKSNIFLSVLGFGTGNHNDQMMEQVSNQANGNYAFVDSRAEANKVLVEELGSTLVAIAKDVKIQVEFNPAKVAQYRLIGYENRVMAAADFDNDQKDAGEIGAGHSVTALYELVPQSEEPADDPPVGAGDLRYQEPARLSTRAATDELLILKMRYKQPDGDTSTLIEFPVTDSGKRFRQADRDFKLAAAVAGFGMMLRDSPYKGELTMSQITEIATEAARGDDFGYRKEFVDLVKKARQLRGD